MGKGSSKRPSSVSKEQFDKQYEAIFGKFKKEKKDDIQYKPKSGKNN